MHRGPQEDWKTYYDQNLSKKIGRVTLGIGGKLLPGSTEKLEMCIALIALQRLSSILDFASYS